MLVAVTYHYVRPDFRDCCHGINGMEVSAFERQLETLSRLGTFVSTEALLDHVRGRRVLPDKSLLITFDDGLAEQYEQAWPVLQRLGVPALFFANTRPILEESVCTVHKLHLMRAAVSPVEFQQILGETGSRLGVHLNQDVDRQRCAEQYPYDAPDVGRVKYLINFHLSIPERTALIDDCFSRLFPDAEGAISREFYMNRLQLKHLAASGSLGTHAHDHLPIEQLDPLETRRMITESVDLLTTWTAVSPKTLSYPYGLADTCSPKTAAVAAGCGIELGFTVESALNDEESLQNPHFLGRFDCNLVPGGKRPMLTADNLFSPSVAARWHSPVSLPLEVLCPVPPVSSW